MKNKKMKIARIECDMTQDDLAKAVGVTRQTISMIEAGNYNPTLKLCNAICNKLNKTLNDLFWEDETK
jgi:putative transcriptional regulator